MNNTESTSFHSLLYSTEIIQSTVTISNVRDHFKEIEVEYLAVTGPTGICGLISRECVDRTVSGKFGWSLFADKPVSEIMIRPILVADIDSNPLEALRLALKRPVEVLFTDIAISSKGKFCGLVSIRSLMNWQMNQHDLALTKMAQEHELLKRTMASNLLDQKVSPELWEKKLSAVAATAAEIELIEQQGVGGDGMAGKMNLQGSLGDFSLIDLLQLLVQGNKSGRLDIVCGEGEYALQFALYLDKGAIVHAEGAGESGHSALWKAFGTDKGQFCFIFGLRTVTKTITENPLYLLMEACQRLDESKRVDSIEQLMRG